jgi:Ribbon-helix-helix protein, copG family
VGFVKLYYNAYYNMVKVMPTLSIRLDARTASLVDRVAAQTRKTKSDILREAIGHYAEVIKNSESNSPYEKIAHLIGSWDSGGKQLSTRTGEKFATMLKQDTNVRRSDRRRSARRDHR